MKPALVRIEGRTVALEPFAERFVSDSYLGWLKDDETTRWLVKAGPSVGLDEVRAFCRTMIDSADDCFFAIVDKTDGAHIGNVRLGHIDWAAGESRFGMMIGTASARGRGIGTEVMGLVERFAFDVLKLDALRFPVVADHAGALRMYEKAGFAVLGPWPEDFVKDGRSFAMVAVGKRRPS